MEFLESVVAWMGTLHGPTPYLLVFAMLLGCGIGIPIPEDITLFAAGFFCYESGENIWAMIAVCLAGVMIGDSFIFYLGSRFGRKLLSRPFFSRVLHPERMTDIENRLKRGKGILFAARFMPGFRTPIFFSAGVLKIPFRTFFALDGIAALISVPALTYATFHFGEDLERVVKVIRKLEYGIFIVILSLIAIFVLKWWIGRRRSLSQ